VEKRHLSKLIIELIIKLIRHHACDAWSQYRASFCLEFGWYCYPL